MFKVIQCSIKESFFRSKVQLERALSCWLLCAAKLDTLADVNGLKTTIRSDSSFENHSLPSPHETRIMCAWKVEKRCAKLDRTRTYLIDYRTWYRCIKLTVLFVMRSVG